MPLGNGVVPTRCKASAPANRLPPQTMTSEPGSALMVAISVARSPPRDPGLGPGGLVVAERLREHVTGDVSHDYLSLFLPLPRSIPDRCCSEWLGGSRRIGRVIGVRDRRRLLGRRVVSPAHRGERHLPSGLATRITELAQEGRDVTDELLHRAPMTSTAGPVSGPSDHGSPPMGQWIRHGQTLDMRRPLHHLQHPRTASRSTGRSSTLVAHCSTWARSRSSIPCQFWLKCAACSSLSHPSWVSVRWVWSPEGLSV
jgi:hypothetical protein